MATAAALSSTEALPVRGPAVRGLGLALPPERMPLVRDGRPLKRWRYVGVYTAELMLCVGEAHVAGLPQRWWAVALPDGTLVERTTIPRGGVELTPSRVRVAARAQSGTDVSIELELGDAAPIEVVSPHGGSYIWTAKRAPVQVRGEVRVGSELFGCHGEHGFIDESAGYHARRTAWRWSAGIGRSGDGRAVAWNLVDGVHDAPEGERAHGLDRRRAARGRAAAVRRGSLTGRRPRLRALVRARALDVARPRAEPLRAAVREIQRRAARRTQRGLS